MHTPTVLLSGVGSCKSAQRRCHQLPQIAAQTKDAFWVGADMVYREGVE